MGSVLMVRRNTAYAKSALLILTIIACIGCNSAHNTELLTDSDPLVQNPASSGENPVDAGEGFVFGVAELFSDNALAIVDVPFVAQGETPRLELLDNGSTYHPNRHSSGLVTVTELCRSDEDSVIEYRRISVLTVDGETSPLTPCSNQISSPSGFTWIDFGTLSPSGQQLAAQLVSSGEPPISIVFENGQEIARFPGFGRPTWLDDDTLVLVGSTLVTARLGEEPIVISDAVAGLSLGAVAVSPDGSQLVFEWERALWIMNVNGSGLRELLPAQRYIFPAWSPDGRWIATMQQEALTALDVQIAASAGFFVYTNLAIFTIVNVETGEQFSADVSIHLDNTQMPQGGLSWY